MNDEQIREMTKIETSSITSELRSIRTALSVIGFVIAGVGLMLIIANCK